ncbi:MAG: KEOPS complex subunit Pcc1 [Thermoplasmata archaeon]
MSKISCTLELEYKSSKKAQSIARSLSPDNQGYIEIKVKGRSLRCYADADTALSLLHTVDDFLACLTVAEAL